MSATKLDISLKGCARHADYQIAKELLSTLIASPELQALYAINLQFLPFGNVDYAEELRSSQKEILNTALFPTLFVRISNHTKLKNEQHSSDEYYNLESLVEWAKSRLEFQFATSHPEQHYVEQAETEFQTLISNCKNPVITMNISIDSMPADTLYIELFKDKCPATVAHFIALLSSNGPNYNGSEFTRSVKNGWIQGGNIAMEDQSTLLQPILPDENFVVKHGKRGTLSLVNKGPNTSVSAFMLTFASSLPHFNQKYVAFGRVVEGSKALAKMEAVETRFERPVKSIILQSISLI